jgi:hypothetical protein
MTHFLCWTRRLALLALALGLAGCDVFGESDDDRPVTTGVFVGNQGNFSDGNGSITAHDPLTNTTDTLAVKDFKSILQSVSVHDGILYATGNSGNRLFRFDVRTLAPLSAIDVHSPRYVAVDGRTAYVTSLEAEPGTFSGGRLNVVDLERGVVTQALRLGQNPEGVVVHRERVLVASHGFGAGTNVLVYDPAGGQVDTVDAQCMGPRELHPVSDARVWVVCTGRVLYDASFNVIGSDPGGLRLLERQGDRYVVVDRVTLSERVSTSGPGQSSAYDAERGVLYAVVGGEVRRFAAQTGAAESFGLPPSSDPIGAVAVDPASGRLYVGWVTGFTTRGYVTVHESDGAQVERFEAGIAPASIAFAVAGD